MSNQESFNMTYSAQQQEEIQSIREKYLPRQESKLERLRALDAVVSRKAGMASNLVGLEGTIWGSA